MSRLPRVLSPPLEWLHRHERLLWALHSAWALTLGVAVMWLGARSYAWLRVTLFHLAFLWVASLFVPALVDRPNTGTRWRSRLRLVINYFTKNFYQQLLFFLLPIYWASASFDSTHFLFILLLALSALVSTLDVVYDQHLSVRRGLTAVFFAFNLFACINVVLPVVWGVANRTVMPTAAVLAIAAFATIRCRGGGLMRWPVPLHLAAAGVVLVLVVSYGRPLIPPAPLRVIDTQFGLSVDRRALRVRLPVWELRPGWTGRVYAVTSIYAPLGLHDRIGHRWYQDDRLLFASAPYKVEGVGSLGYRLWTSGMVTDFGPGSRLRLDVVTDAGQLVGRAVLHAAVISAAAR